MKTSKMPKKLGRPPGSIDKRVIEAEQMVNLWKDELEHLRIQYRDQGEENESLRDALRVANKRGDDAVAEARRQDRHICALEELLLRATRMI